MKKQNKRYQTQWAGQFGAAHELTRRNYLVTFTTGNAPAADLLCESPQGRVFSVQVKSLRSKTYFLYQKQLVESKPDRFFIFVLLPSMPSQRPEYFVMSDKQFLKLVEEEKEITAVAEKKRGRPYADFSPGLAYGTIARHGFQDAWSNLPA